MLDFSFYFKDVEELKIDRPIFLLGVQGGGLTLVSRMLRRNKSIVSVTGNYNYWYGADEMQNVLWPLLPPELTGIKHRFPSDKDFISPRGWLYACDKLIDDYRNSAEDVTSGIKTRFRKIIRWTISRHAIDRKKARFTDKSQVFTVKLAFLNKLLEGTGPKFILITRNPYALCWRSVNKKREAPELKKAVKKFCYKKALDLASQHWANSMKYALQDGERMNNFLTLKFEDILKNPKEKMKEICNFAELEFNPDMLPQKEHEIGLGRRKYNQDKWYPLRPKINKQYLEKINSKDIEIIDNVVGEIAKRLEYGKPNSRS